MGISIGRLSVATGVKVPTIRYYEQIGLLPEGVREKGNHRRYDEATVRRLLFIRQARDLGFEIHAIRDLLQIADAPRSPWEDLRDAAAKHLADVRERIARLRALEAELTRLEGEYRHGRSVESRLLSVVAPGSEGDRQRRRRCPPLRS